MGIDQIRLQDPELEHPPKRMLQLGPPGPAVPEVLQAPNTASSGLRSTRLSSGFPYRFFFDVSDIPAATFLTSGFAPFNAAHRRNSPPMHSHRSI